jgi:PAS domain S-box-containing protein
VTPHNLGPQIWDAFPFSVVVSDYVAEPKQRKIVYVNPAFTHLTGFAAEQAIGKPLTLLDGPGPTQPELWSAMRRSRTARPMKRLSRRDGRRLEALQCG